MARQLAKLTAFTCLISVVAPISGLLAQENSSAAVHSANSYFIQNDEQTAPEAGTVYCPCQQCSHDFDWRRLRCCGKRRCQVGSIFRWTCFTQEDEFADVCTEPLVTDRPDFTEASSVVGLGVAQLETGYRYFYDNDGSRQLIVHSYPEALLRYGIFRDWLELRIGFNYFTEQVNGARTTGPGEFYIGAKVGLTPQAGALPEMALIVQALVPVSDRITPNDDVLPGIVWAYSWDLTDNVSFGGNTGLTKIPDGATDTGYLVTQSFAMGLALTDKLGAYGEWFGLFPSATTTRKPEHYVDGGFTYLVSNDIQVDIEGGIGLNDAAADYFIGTGLSIRFK